MIDRLRELHKQVTDLRTATIQKADVPLSGAVQRYFGTMRREGHDLRFRTIKERNQPLFYAAKKLFGSFTNAVAEAGSDYWHMSQAQLKLDREARRREAP